MEISRRDEDPGPLDESNSSSKKPSNDGSSILPLIVILLVSTGLRWGSWNAYFSGDDGMNLIHLHGLWTKSIASLITAALSVFTTEYRPVGGIVYRIMHAMFDMELLPYRILSYSLFTINLVVTYKFIRVIATRGIALVSTAVMAYHGALGDLYYNFGTVYELLAYSFSVLCMYCYLRFRRSLSTTALVLAMHGLALGSKEIAVSIPLVLYLWDILLRRRWIPSTPVFALMIESAVFLAVKVGMPNEMSTNPLYVSDRSLSTVMTNASYYVSRLLYQDGPANDLYVVVTSVCVGIAVIVLRSRLIWWGVMTFAIASIPLLSIPPRGAYVLYLPVLGLAVAFGAMCEMVRVKLAVRRIDVWATGIVLGMGVLHYEASKRIETEKQREHALVRSIIEDTSSHLVKMTEGSRVFFLADPFAADNWILKFLLQLKFKDPSLLVERKKTLSHYEDEELGLYDFVISTSADRTIVNSNIDNAVRRTDDSKVVVRFVPPQAAAGQPFHATVPGIVESSIDVAYRLLLHGKVAAVGVARDWTRLDAQSSAELIVPIGHPPAMVEIEAVRARGQKWQKASGAMIVLP